MSDQCNCLSCAVARTIREHESAGTTSNEEIIVLVATILSLWDIPPSALYLITASALSRLEAARDTIH